MLTQAKSSVGAALGVAQGAGGGALTDAVRSSFMTAFHAGCLVAASVCAVGVLAALALPGRPRPMPVLAPAELAVQTAGWS